jgi:hypothetical protein
LLDSIRGIRWLKFHNLPFTAAEKTKSKLNPKIFKIL